uniref:HTH CENPB-type domain-containing protein n=1 Tax=Latimeria chalumnae TaxID=7897 RepID=H3AJP3_LATCH
KNKKISEKKHKSLSVNTKYQIITAVDAGNKKATADEFGVLPNTLSTVTLLKPVKKLHVSEHKEVEDALYTRFKSAGNDNIRLSGPILAAKAEKLAADLGNENFTVSHSWIERFKKKKKKHRNIVSKSICGVSGSDSTVVDEYITSKLPALLKDCKKMLAIKGENCHGGKHSKERIIVMVSANMDGSEKLKPLVIGKSQKPRCFKNMKSLPVDYKANTQAWMTSDIFSEWVKKFDRKMECQKHKMVVFIDNCPVHLTVATLKATTVIFLPPNFTSKLQPMDQGIIKSFKQNYRCLLLQHVIACFESWENTEINLLQAIQFAHHAWCKVTMRCISSCFAKAGFCINERNEETENLSDEEDNIPLSGLVESWKTIRVHMEIASDLTVEDYIDVDKNVINIMQLTEAEIVAARKFQDGASGDKESESDEEYEPE